MLSERAGPFTLGMCRLEQATKSKGETPCTARGINHRSVAALRWKLCANSARAGRTARNVNSSSSTRMLSGSLAVSADVRFVENSWSGASRKKTATANLHLTRRTATYESGIFCAEGQFYVQKRLNMQSPAGRLCLFIPKTPRLKRQAADFVGRNADSERGEQLVWLA